MGLGIGLLPLADGGEEVLSQNLPPPAGQVVAVAIQCPASLVIPNLTLFVEKGWSEINEANAGQPGVLENLFDAGLSAIMIGQR